MEADAKLYQLIWRRFVACNRDDASAILAPTYALPLAQAVRLKARGRILR